MKFRVSPFSFDFFFTQSAQRERSVATTITTPDTAFTLTKRTRFEPHLSGTHMQQRKENTAVSARPAEMCLCKDAEIKERGGPAAFKARAFTQTCRPPYPTSSRLLFFFNRL